jgi:CD109 antigen
LFLIFQLVSKTFEVAEYVLPKFEITISEPVYNTYKKKKLIFGVQAKYTYGKSVIGTVTFNQSNPSTSNQSERVIYKTIPIDGQITVELDLVKDLRMNLSSRIFDATYIQFELTVLEELTGISLNKTVFIPIYVNEYQISHIDNGNRFKPGLMFGFFAKVTRPDGKPVFDSLNPVEVVVEYGTSTLKSTELTYNLDEQGMAFVKVNAPLTAERLEFNLDYKDKSHRYLLFPAKSKSKTYIQANVLTKP